jgi:hypothetical protein
MVWLVLVHSRDRDRRHTEHYQPEHRQMDAQDMRIQYHASAGNLLDLVSHRRVPSKRVSIFEGIHHILQRD